VDVFLGAAFSSTPRCPKNATQPWQSNSCEHAAPADFQYMGYSLRVPLWRYNEWRAWNGSKLAADWAAAPVALELYAHEEDPSTTDYDLTENVNLSSDPLYAGVVEQLSGLLHAQFNRPRASFGLLPL
jgi:hypothetical protein